MWEPSGGAVVCSESFRSCASAVPVDGRVFGPGQRTESVAPQSRRLLMEVARLTRSGRGDMTEAEPLELWTGGTVPVPASDGKKLLMGGQYLRVPGGTTLRVDFDIEVAGAEAIVDLHQDVFLNGYEQFARKGIQVRGGERWRLSYQIAVPKDSSQLVVQLYATTVAGVEGSIEFHDARLSMTSSTEGSPRVVVIRDEVSPAAPR